MNRLKFLLFALVALGVVGYLVYSSPEVAKRNAEQEGSRVAAAAPSIALKVEAQRSQLQAAVVKLAASPVVWNAKVGPKPEAPSVDRFSAVRTSVLDALSETNKAAVVVAVANDVGALVALGSADPGQPPEGFSVQPLLEGGASGAVTVFGGQPYLFYATPMLVSDKNEVRVQGNAIVGLPLLPDAKSLEALARELKLSALGIVSKDKLLLLVGSDKVQAEAALKSVKVGDAQPLVVGAVRELGPLSLPLFVPNAPHAVGARQTISGTPFESFAIVSVREPIDALAAFQVSGVLTLLGLVLLSVVFTLLIKPEDEGGGLAVPPPVPLPPVAVSKPKEDVTAPSLPIGIMGGDQPHHAPEASPDDFHFPASAPPVSQPPVQSSASSFAISTPSMMGNAPASAVTGQNVAFNPASAPPQGGLAPLFDGEDPFAAAGPPVQPQPPPRATGSGSTAAIPRPSNPKPAPPTNPFDDDEPSRTVAYPTFPPGTAKAAAPVSAMMTQPVSAPPVEDPFAMAAGQMSADEANQQSAYDDNPDATRVAAVPQELIKAARAGASGNTGERPSMKMAGPALPKVQSVVGAPAGADVEDRHFQDVFRDFVATREKCGEPADGLTYEKFKTKLLKNKEQLVTKYQCKTVRFQVYVKEGKAALKATPVKD
jgi:hypothetical protein